MFTCIYMYLGKFDFCSLCTHRLLLIACVYVLVRVRNAYKQKYVYIHMYTRVCIYTRTHDSVTVHICIYVHTHTHTHIYIHPNIITYIYIPDERCGRRMEPFHHILWRACGVQAIRYFFCSPPSTSSSECVYTY